MRSKGANVGIPEISGLLLIIFSLFILLCLVTHTSIDYALIEVKGRSVNNVGGRLGFYLSSFLLECFGLGSYFIITVLISWGFAMFYQGSISAFHYKAFGFLVAISSLSYILSGIKKYELFFEFPIGGYLGFYLVEPFYHTHLFPPFFILSILVFLLSGFYTIEIENLPIRERAVSIIHKICDALFGHKAFKPTKQAKTQPEAGDVHSDGSQSIISDAVQSQTFNGPKDQPRRSAVKYSPPSISLLSISTEANQKKHDRNQSITKRMEQELAKTLKDFGIEAEIKGSSVGPVITMYEIEPEAGVRAARIIGLSDDIARSLKAKSCRISLIPGKSSLAVEIPNVEREIVFLREMFQSAEYQQNSFTIPICLGKNIIGDPIVVDLASMPHLLVAGTTGSGKSVGINSMINSVLYKLSPDECKFIMIDPKMLELSVYEGIPHLLSPVITSPEHAVIALKWVVKEMERRYKAMSLIGVRSIFGYNDAIPAAKVNTAINYADMSENPYDGTSRMPFIVVIIDEMADLMITAGKAVESAVQRLSQMARAAGIHIIMATQRPSVDVITGVIKANFPTRISYQVTSKVDSRTILGFQGGESLLGMGDMLYMPTGGKTYRIHAPFASDKEVADVVAYLKKQYPTSSHLIDFSLDLVVDDGSDPSSRASGVGHSGELSDEDMLYQKAIEVVTTDDRPSISYVQRRLRIGYNKAASLIERMEDDGIVGQPDSTGKRLVLRKRDQ